MANINTQGLEINPSNHQNLANREITQNNPVENVSWEDVNKFIQVLNQLFGLEETPYRLPTEAEWEYAARAKSNSAFWFGSDPTQFQEKTIKIFSTGDWTRPVASQGSFSANPFGLFDIYGNVAEWTSDHYATSLETAIDPHFPLTGQDVAAVVRGGSYEACASYIPDDIKYKYLRSAYRSWFTSSKPHNAIGFRLVRSTQN